MQNVDTPMTHNQVAEHVFEIQCLNMLAMSAIGRPENGAAVDFALRQIDSRLCDLGDTYQPIEEAKE